MASCRSCGAPIRWAVTAKGKRVPLDAEPVEDGNVQIIGEDEEGEALVAFLSKGNEATLFPALEPRYVTHFVTCPDREAWRHRED